MYTIYNGYCHCHIDECDSVADASVWLLGLTVSASVADITQSAQADSCRA